jgi:ribonuclease HII
MSSKTFPTLKTEQELFDAGNRFVIGIDEVGRGSLFGPVAVGVAVLRIDAHSGVQSGSQNSWPAQLADSKLISEKVREAIFEPTAAWVTGWAVGMADNTEIDELGITKCLALSALRAIKALDPQIRADIAAAPELAQAILDSSHNWLGDTLGPVAVQVRTKADRDCVSVAAASVLAKVTRDRHVVSLCQENPQLETYGISGNKGYSSAQHLEALRTVGPTDLHRRTWLTKILAEDALF